MSAGTGPAHAASAPTIEHWGAFFGGSNTFKPVDVTRSPASLALPGPVAEIATSNSTQYALLANGDVYAWGLGNAGQLGNGSTASSFSKPVRVRFPAGVTIASLPIDVMPFDTGLAVDTTGHVWGWGANSAGQLCLGNTAQHTTPVELPFSDVSTLAGAGGHALYDAGGQVYACGLNTVGELGNGSTANSKVPVKVKGLGPFAHVRLLVASFANSGGLLANGAYLDWGYNAQGQLGNGTVHKPATVPVLVTLPHPVSQVTQGGSLPGNGQTIVLLSDGSLYAWGDDSEYQLGDERTVMEPSPVRIFPPPGVRYRALASGGTTSYAISVGGNVYAWGGDKVGQVGDGGTVIAAVRPVLVASGATSISSTAADVAISLRGG